MNCTPSSDSTTCVHAWACAYYVRCRIWYCRVQDGAAVWGHEGSATRARGLDCQSPAACGTSFPGCASHAGQVVSSAQTANPRITHAPLAA